MKARIAAVVAAALTVTGLAALPAQAASSGSGGSIGHPDVTLYSGQHNKTAKISYSVKDPTRAQIKACFDDESYPEDGEVYTGWGDLGWSLDVEYLDRRGNLVGGGAFLYDGEDPQSGRATSSRWYDWETFGRYTAKATITRYFSVYGVDDDGWDWEHLCLMPDVTYSDAFSFKRASYLTVNASPEPVRKGRAVSVKGTLNYWNPEANYGDGAHRPLRGQKVKIYFDPAGSRGPVYKGSTTVSAKGTWSRSFTQAKSGTWVARYAGTSTVTPDRASDAVRVR